VTDEVAPRPPEGPGPPTTRRRQVFPKACRILRRGDFLRIQGHAQRIHGKRLILQFGSPPSAVIESRLGLTVSKKVGPSVLRNQLKRWLREAFRRAPPELRPRREPGATTEPYDVVVTVKRGIDDFSFAVLQDELLHGIERHLQSRQTRPARAGKPRARPPGPAPRDAGRDRQRARGD